MQIYVYTGPTLTHSEGKEFLDACYQPPIKHGDIINAMDEGADCIVIVDGFYDSMPAIRHKEILHALAAGVRVLGSSSMGAMRAAELDLFGMEGFGEIYQMYKSGLIDGDDEVAIKHAPESEGFRQLSLPLVNLRYNLQQMQQLGQLSAADAALLVDCAKQMYFGARSIKRVFNIAKERGLAAETIERCQQYFQTHWHDVKKADAQQLLKTLQQRESGHQPWPAPIQPPVNRTNFLYRWTVEQARVNTRLGTIREQEVLAQFKFASDQYPKIRQQVNERAWLRDYAERLDISVSGKELQDCRTKLSKALGIDDEPAWLAARALTTTQFDELIRTEALVEKLVQSRGETDRASLLLEYARARGLSASEAEINEEWPRFYQEIKAAAATDAAFDLTKLSQWLKVDLMVAPPTAAETVPAMAEWAEQHQLPLAEFKLFLSERRILRKLALNFYITPGIIYREPILVELKLTGLFHNALEELLAVYESISQKGISSDWHPQWKMFVQSDIRVVLQWFCKKRQLSPKIARDFIKWKGFDDFMEFVDIAQLNYIAQSQPAI